MFNLPQNDLDNISKSLFKFKDLFENKSFLITGGTGFIGKWLIAGLMKISDDYDLNIFITILTRDKNAFIKSHNGLLDNPKLNFIERDIRNLDNPFDKENEFDFIVLGANDATYDFSLDLFSLTDTLINGTYKLLKNTVSDKTKSILHLSSGAVYGDITKCNKGVSENKKSNFDLTNKGSMYGVTKALVESILNEFGNQNNINIINARCFAFVGPYLPLDRHFAIGNFIKNCLNKNDIVVNGDGSPVRSYMYASDMACSILGCLTIDESIYINIGSDKPVSIKELAEKISKISSTKMHIKQRNLNHPEKSNFYIPDIELLNSYNFCEFVDLDSSILRTINFYKNLSNNI